ncbi:MAG: hypothetical protein RIS29_3202 [Bacteroidota bacterium]|jgi:hypothetical protein
MLLEVVDRQIHTMLRAIRISVLFTEVLMIILLRNQRLMIEIIIWIEAIYLTCKYLFIQIQVWRKKFYSIGIRRFYFLGLIHQLIISIGFYIAISYQLHKSFGFNINNLAIAGLYLGLMLLLDSRKHIFLISHKYVTHKHNWKLIQWKLADLQKVYIYPHKIEFVKGHTKLKAIFDEDIESSIEIVDFLKPLIGNKLRIKDESKFHNFE